MCKTAVFPGSFNPFTIGHLSVVERGTKIFDELIVAIGINSAKTDPEDVACRIERIKAAVSHINNVKVISYSGLTVEVCKQFGADFILRGVRSVADFEYERNLADVNRKISGIETVLLFSLPEHAAVSSSVIRELDKFGYDTTPFLP